MAAPVLHFVVVGHDDHPIFETDLLSKSTDASGREVRETRVTNADCLQAKAWLLGNLSNHRTHL